MLIAAKNNPETKTMATKLQAEQVASWLSKDKSADDVFTLLQLNKATGNQLDAREFMLWSKYLDDLKIPNKETTMLSTMSAHYGDDVVSEMLIAAKKTTSTASIARKLQTEQLRLWLKQKKSADDVFTMLQLNKADDALFDIPEFTLWSKYLDDLDVKFPRKEMTMVSTLATHYSDEAMINLINSAKNTPGMKSLATRTNVFQKPEFETWLAYMVKLDKYNPDSILSALKEHYKDDVLAKMIIAAKQAPETKTMATGLQNEQIRLWQADKKSADDVFNLLQLNKVDDNLLANSEFAVWINYLDGLKLPTKDWIIWSTISSHYTDDVLSRMLIAAKDGPDTKIMATKLQADQVANWLSQHLPADDVFTLLQLNKATGNQLDIREFMLWSKYLDDLEIPNKEATMVSTMSAHYKDDVVSQMLIAAKKTANTENIATKLQAEQLRVWLSKKKSADDVFKLLQLNKADDTLFDSSEFTLWSKYLDDLDVKFPSKELTMVSTISTYYSDETAAKLVIYGKNKAGLENLATSLESTQTNKWLEGGISPENVFRFYQLDKAGDSLLASPQLNTWVTYMNKFNSENPSVKKTTVFGTFTQIYGDERLAKILIAAEGVEKTKKLATDFQMAQIKYWLRNNQSPENVFRFYQLDKAGDNLLDSPQLNTWVTYMNKFNSENPSVKKTTMLGTFTQVYGNERLAEILIAAKGVEKTKKLATDFQTAQINYWLRSNQKPGNVQLWLGMTKSNPSEVESLVFQDYLKRSITKGLALKKSQT
ncbi:Avirulence (Avh) protein [Phytophthora megakarya]|uniref:Avirulence (Avh) protein n=1 Tax=Phytophthora megakarya TaxID=4795 RepID=A0A225WKL0_9STRA|nr:Avirulence (Avh) protein [Phytophthora megakarya]